MLSKQILKPFWNHTLSEIRLLMVTKRKLDASALEGALIQIKDALSGGDFNLRFTTSLELLKLALQCLIDNDSISRLAVEVGASTDNGKHYIYEYSLGTRKVQGGDEDECLEETYLKQSMLEEYE